VRACFDCSIQLPNSLDFYQQRVLECSQEHFQNVQMGLKDYPLANVLVVRAKEMVKMEAIANVHQN